LFSMADIIPDRVISMSEGDSLPLFDQRAAVDGLGI